MNNGNADIPVLGVGNNEAQPLIQGQPDVHEAQDQGDVLPLRDQLQLQSAALSIIPTFYGDEKDVAHALEFFITTVEENTDGIRHRRCQIAKAKLRGAAQEYISVSVDLQAERNWNTFRNQLRARFAQAISRSILMRRLATMKQRDDELVA